MQKLLCLSLEGQPSADVIAGTLLAWHQVITHRRQFDEARDRPRFEEAFLTLAQRSRRWPTPADFLESLPRIESQPVEGKRIESAASKAAAEKAIAEIGELLHVKQPEDYPKPPPLAPVDDFPRCCAKGTREQPVCDECRAWAQETHGDPRRLQTPEEEANDFLG